ncbi:hypothetical protein ACFLS8_01090 [Chloroflexota bacterium]
MRFVLGGATLIAAVGAIFKLSGISADGTALWLDTGSVVITFLGLGLAVLVILTLFIMAKRYRGGNHVPSWLEPVIIKDD